MLDDVFDDGLYFVFRHYVVNALSESCEHLVDIGLLRIQKLDESSVEGKEYQLVSPDDSAYKGHVDQLMSIFFASAVHDVEQFLHEDLRVVNQVNGHEVSVTRLYFFLSQATRSLSLVLLNLVLSCFGLSVDALLSLDFRRVDSLILALRQLLKRHSGLHQKVAGHLPQSARRRKASLSNDVDSSVVSPDILLVKLNHQLQRLLGSFVGVFGDVPRNKRPDLLIDLIVLVMAVHSPDVVDHVLVDHRPEFFVLKSHLLQQKLSGAHRKQDALSPQNHDAAHAFLANVGVERRS